MGLKISPVKIHSTISEGTKVMIRDRVVKTFGNSRDARHFQSGYMRAVNDIVESLKHPYLDDPKFVKGFPKAAQHINKFYADSRPID